MARIKETKRKTRNGKVIIERSKPQRSKKMKIFIFILKAIVITIVSIGIIERIIHGIGHFKR